MGGHRLGLQNLFKSVLGNLWAFLHSPKVDYKSRKSPPIFSLSKISLHPIPGTVKGGGFDCRDGTVDAFDGHKEGVWNRVRESLPHIGWISDINHKGAEKEDKFISNPTNK